MKLKTCCIVGNFNGHGLSRDAAIIEEVLFQLGFQVVRKQRRDRRFWSVFWRSNQYDLLIFLETIYLRWLFSGKKTVLIPNQEWFKAKKLPYLNFVDQVWCKSMYATTIFKKHASEKILVSFVGFTSLKKSETSDSSYLTGIEPARFERFLHVAGGSQSKGTHRIIDVWKKHKNLPHLTIVQRAGNAPDTIPDNVTVITDYLSESEMARLRNLCGVHLCPSESEGFGHNLFQGMLAGAVVVTVDFPPMNELIRNSFGFLLSPNAIKPRRLGHSCFYDCSELEALIRNISGRSHLNLESMGEQARLRALDLDSEFRRRFSELLSSLKI